MKNFQELKVWKLGIQIVKEVYIVSKLIPGNEQFGLINQITRAAVSIPSHIAEGSSRNSDKEYKRFLEIALGSSFELQTQILILNEIDYLNHETVKKLIEMIQEEQKMLQVFISKINHS